VIGNYRNLVLGLGWGNTTSYLATFFETPAESSVSSVVSLLGNLTTESESHPYVPAESVAKKVGASFLNIWAPSIAQSKEGAVHFRQEARIREVLDVDQSVKLAVLSIGEFSDQNHLIRMGCRGSGYRKNGSARCYAVVRGRAIEAVSFGK
jgi:DNA-binding transcriptional regulator LsrR (DeoR family)